MQPILRSDGCSVTPRAVMACIRAGYALSDVVAGPTRWIRGAIVKTCGSACWAGRDHRLDRASQGAEDGVHVRLQMEGFEHCQELAFLVAEVGLHDGGDSLEVAVKLGRAGAVIHRLL